MTKQRNSLYCVSEWVNECVRQRKKKINGLHCGCDGLIINKDNFLSGDGITLPFSPTHRWVSQFYCWSFQHEKNNSSRAVRKMIVTNWHRNEEGKEVGKKCENTDRVALSLSTNSIPTTSSLDFHSSLWSYHWQ